MNFLHDMTCIVLCRSAGLKSLIIGFVSRRLQLEPLLQGLLRPQYERTSFVSISQEAEHKIRSTFMSSYFLPKSSVSSDLFETACTISCALPVILSDVK